MSVIENNWKAAGLQIGEHQIISSNYKLNSITEWYIHYHTASGATAGFVETCVMNPLDLVKTRMQLQIKATSTTNLPAVCLIYLNYFQYLKL